MSEARKPEVAASENDVVDQPGFANPNSANCRVAVSHRVHALEGVGVYDGEIAWRETRHPLEHPPADRLECAGSALPALKCITQSEQRLREFESELPILWREISVTAGHRHSVGVAHDRRHQNAKREIQVANHRLYGCNLLQILLSEDRNIGHHDVKELRHHRQHSLEVMRTLSAFPLLPHGPGMHLHNRGV